MHLLLLLLLGNMLGNGIDHHREEGEGVEENGTPVGNHDEEVHPPHVNDVALSCNADVRGCIDERAEDCEENAACTTRLQAADDDGSGEQLGIDLGGNAEGQEMAGTVDTGNSVGSGSEQQSTKDNSENFARSWSENNRNILLSRGVLSQEKASDVKKVTNEEESHTDRSEISAHLHDDITKTIEEEYTGQIPCKRLYFSETNSNRTEEKHERPNNKRLHTKEQSTIISIETPCKYSD